MKRVLFICTHNSARSQMAEALLKESCGEFFHIESAGTQPGQLNPLAVEAIAELGIDISRKQDQKHLPLHHEQCPTFPAGARYVHWSFPDPSKFAGTHAEKVARTREVRDAIKARIQAWCEETCLRNACKLQLPATNLDLSDSVSNSLRPFSTGCVFISE